MGWIFPAQDCPHCGEGMELGGEACPWCGRDPLVPSHAPLTIAVISVAASVVAIVTGGFSYAEYAVDAVGWLFSMN